MAANHRDAKDSTVRPAPSRKPAPWWAVSLLCLAATATHAQAPACAEATTQAAMNACAAADFADADRDLNRAYTQLQQRLETSRKTALREVQRSWLTYRDAQCAFDAKPYAGGSMAPLVRATCLGALTKQRTQLLDRLSKDTER